MSGAARDQWRAQVAAALTDWRLFAIPPRQDFGRERQLVQAAIAEVLAIRLIAAYAPLLAALARIEARLAVLACTKRDPWAPPARVAALPVEAGDLPAFIRGGGAAASHHHQSTDHQQEK